MQFFSYFIYFFMTSFQSRALKMYVSNSIFYGFPKGCEGSSTSPFKKISDALLCVSENEEIIKQEGNLEILLQENNEKNPYIINNLDFNLDCTISPFARLPGKE